MRGPDVCAFWSFVLLTLQYFYDQMSLQTDEFPYEGTSLYKQLLEKQCSQSKFSKIEIFLNQKLLPILAFKLPAIKSTRRCPASGTYRLTFTWREENRPPGSHLNREEGRKIWERRLPKKLSIFQGFMLGAPRHHGEERLKGPCEGYGKSSSLELTMWVQAPGHHLLVM